MTLRRSGTGWLVVQGPSPSGRDAVLAALRTDETPEIPAELAP